MGQTPTGSVARPAPWDAGPSRAGAQGHLRPPGIRGALGGILRSSPPEGRLDMRPRVAIRLLVPVTPAAAHVDDFKMAGPAGNLEKGWKTITSGIKLVGVGPVSTCLGREHATFSDHVDAKPVRGIQYRMQPFMESCVEAYRKVVG